MNILTCGFEDLNATFPKFDAVSGSVAYETVAPLYGRASAKFDQSQIQYLQKAFPYTPVVPGSWQGFHFKASVISACGLLQWLTGASTRGDLRFNASRKLEARVNGTLVSTGSKIFNPNTLYHLEVFVTVNGTYQQIQVKANESQLFALNFFLASAAVPAHYDTFRWGPFLGGGSGILLLDDLVVNDSSAQTGGDYSWTGRIAITDEGPTDPGTGEVTIEWAANTEPDLAGYRVYWDSDSSPPYAHSQDVGNVLEYTVTGLAIGMTWYFSVTAYDTFGNESVPLGENEVSQFLTSPSQPPIEEWHVAGAANVPLAIEELNHDGDATYIYAQATRLRQSIVFANPSQPVGGILQAVGFDVVARVTRPSVSKVKLRFRSSDTPVNEFQRITITEGEPGDTFTFGYEGVNSPSLAFNASLAAVQAEADVIFGALGCVVTGTPGSQYVFAFAAHWSQTRMLMIQVSGVFGGSGSPSIAIARITPGEGIYEAGDPFGYIPSVTELPDDAITDAYNEVLPETHVSRTARRRVALDGGLWTVAKANATSLAIRAEIPS